MRDGLKVLCVVTERQATYCCIPNGHIMSIIVSLKMKELQYKLAQWFRGGLFWKYSMFCKV